VTAASKPLAQTTWTDDDDATATAMIDLDLAWSIAVNGGVTPLGTQHLPPITVAADARRHGRSHRCDDVDECDGRAVELGRAHEADRAAALARPAPPSIRAHLAHLKNGVGECWRVVGDRSTKGDQRQREQSAAGRGSEASLAGRCPSQASVPQWGARFSGGACSPSHASGARSPARGACSRVRVLPTVLRAPSMQAERGVFALSRAFPERAF